MGTLRERVASIEVVIKELMGNGQPGTVQKLEDDVKKLKYAIIAYVVCQLLSQVTGGGAAVVALIKMLLK